MQLLLKPELLKLSNHINMKIILLNFFSYVGSVLELRKSTISRFIKILDLKFFRKRMGRNNEKVKDKKKERKMMSERMNVG